MGVNYNATSDSGTGSIAINNETVRCVETCRAEYQTPLTTNKSKLSVKFTASAFTSTNFGDGVFIGDNVTTGGCQVMGGYVADGTSYSLALIDKVTATIIESTTATISAGTAYVIEFSINDGTIETTLKNADGTETIATVSASYDDTTCTMTEPSFNGTLGVGDTITFDNFRIEN